MRPETTTTGNGPDPDVDTAKERQRCGSRERMRVFRARRKAGRFVVRLELSADLLDALVAARLLTDGQAADPEALTHEIPAILSMSCRQSKNPVTRNRERS
jgi:hypothetical protein